MLTKIIKSPLKSTLRSRSFSTLSSDVILKDDHLETYYRGTLLKINYSEVRDNPACQEVYYQDAYLDHEEQSPDELFPELVIRKNDMLNFDWNDGTWSSVNLTKLIENKFDDDDFDLEEHFQEIEELEDEELDEVLTKLTETGLSSVDSGLKSTLSKIAFFTEASYYCKTHKSVYDALPSDHNGLAVLTSNKEIKIQLINTIKFSEHFRNRHPKYFKKLATQPSLVYAKSYPSPGWLKCITMDDESEIQEIRLGNVDKLMVGDYTQQAYDCFEYEMQSDEIIFDEENSDDDESFIEEVVLSPGNTVLIDCTTWRLKQNDDVVCPDLKVKSCLLTNDNWKSTARMLKSNN